MSHITKRVIGPSTSNRTSLIIYDSSDESKSQSPRKSTAFVSESRTGKDHSPRRNSGRPPSGKFPNDDAAKKKQINVLDILSTGAGLSESLRTPCADAQQNSNSSANHAIYNGDTKARVSLATKALIGQGSFGKVYQAMDRETNCIIAVKEISFVSFGGTSEAFQTVRNELSLLKLLDHPNIVRYLGEDLDDSSLRIYMEYLPCGSVSSLLKRFGALLENQTAAFLRQVLLGLEYLHSKKIVHRDLKGDNLLVNTDGSLKLADFGTAKDLKNASTLNKAHGTANFMSPEAMNGKRTDEKTDIWSLACCAIEMLTGNPPLSHITNQYSIMLQVAEYTGDILDLYVPKDQCFSENVMDFISKCLRNDPAERPSAKDLLEHPWILEVVFDSQLSLPGEGKRNNLLASKEFEKASFTVLSSASSPIEPDFVELKKGSERLRTAELKKPKKKSKKGSSSKKKQSVPSAGESTKLDAALLEEEKENQSKKRKSKKKHKNHSNSTINVVTEAVTEDSFKVESPSKSRAGAYEYQPKKRAEYRENSCFLPSISNSVTTTSLGSPQTQRAYTFTTSNGEF